MMDIEKVHALRRNLQGPGGFLSIAWCTEMFETLDRRIVFESSFRTMARYSRNGIYLDQQTVPAMRRRPRRDHTIGNPAAERAGWRCGAKGSLRETHHRQGTGGVHRRAGDPARAVSGPAVPPVCLAKAIPSGRVHPTGRRRVDGFEGRRKKYIRRGAGGGVC